MSVFYTCDPTGLSLINQRLAARNVPSAPLRPSYSIRPVPTKYQVMGMEQEAKPPAIKMHAYQNYSTSTIFNPGTAQAPWGGFARSIDTESTLRNQFFALQACPQETFIPGTNSSLYTPDMPPVQDTPIELDTTESCLVQQPEHTFNASSRLQHH